MTEDIRTFKNERTNPIKVWVEPWAGEYQLTPGSALKVVAQSDQIGELDIAEYEGGIGVYGWAGASIKVYQEDTLIDELPIWSHDWLPGGGSIRGFIESAFGGPGKPRPEK